MAQKIDYRTGLYRQADSLKISVDSVERALRDASLAPWLPGETVGVVAMGASSHAGEALLAMLRAAGRRAVNITASDVEQLPAGFQPADHYIIISESGRSPEPISAARLLPPGRRIAITNDPQAPLGDVVDTILPMGGWPDSRVYTTGFTATLLALAALMRKQMPDAEVTDPGAFPSIVAAALRDYADAGARIAELFKDVHAIDFVARGVSLTAAAEGALVVREGCRLPAAWFDTYQYIHGPLEALNGKVGLFVSGEGRELPLVEQVLKHGVRVVLVTQARSLPFSNENLVVVQMPEHLRGIGRATAEIVLMQQAFLHHTDLLGISMDEFLLSQTDTKLTPAHVDNVNAGPPRAVTGE